VLFHLALYCAFGLDQAMYEILRIAAHPLLRERAFSRLYRYCRKNSYCGATGGNAHFYYITKS
jgi:hypothetical protein